jgi:hypothetical protein
LMSASTPCGGGESGTPLLRSTRNTRGTKEIPE